MTTRADLVARLAEYPRRVAIPRSKPRRAQSRRRSCVAIIGALLPLFCMPAGAEATFAPKIGEASNSGNGTKSGEASASRPSDDDASSDGIDVAQTAAPPVSGAGGGYLPAQTPGGPEPGTARPAAGVEQRRLKPRPLAFSIGLRELLTTNVNLAPSSAAKSDLVTLLTPALAIDEKGPRTTLKGIISAPTSIYVRTGAQNNKVYPEVDLLGNAELLERFFFLEGDVSVTQQFFTPFGGQPVDLANATANRYTAASYRVTPYIKGITTDGTRYELRNNNIWTILSSTPVATNSAYYDQWLGTLSGPIARFGWALDYNWNNVKFNDQPPLITELSRAKLIYQADPNVRLDVDGGYEDNRYTFADYKGPIYGVGMQWRPTPRTNLVANWEHRFFGASYLVNFDHRTPLSAIAAQFSRNITSYPQQFLSLPATGNVPLLLNIILASRFPDPAQREQIVNTIITDRGLPTSLAGPVNLYTQQILLQQQGNLTLGLLGARNAVFLVGYYVRTEPISGAGNPLPPSFASGNDNTQKGVTLNWTHNLSPLVTLSATATLSQTLANAPLVGKTNQGTVSLRVAAPISPNTAVYAGVRYQKLNSDVQSDYTEAAIFAGVNYLFQ
jgi:uncharacterized protein (PEP-CTERM system associated)